MNGVPAAVTPEQAAMLGPRLQEPQSYLRALVASTWRQELLLERLVSVLDNAGDLARYKEHLDDIRCDILDAGVPLGDDSDPDLTPRRLVRVLLDERGAREVPAVFTLPADPAAPLDPSAGPGELGDIDAPAATCGEAYGKGLVCGRSPGHSGRHGKGA